MLQIKNKSPFQTALGLFTDPEGRNLVTVVVKATLNCPDIDGVPFVADDQVPPSFVDTYWGDPASSSVRVPADLVVGKLATDVGIVGSAHSPDGKPIRELLSGIRVGEVSKVFHVTGDRHWDKTLGRMSPTDPVPFTNMPLMYERAWGGVTKNRRCALNPVGVGLVVNEGDLLPNLEDPQDRYRGQNESVCVSPGFVAPSWEPRVRFAGTYDEAWRRDQCPLLPHDFDPRFFNCAASGLVANGFLQGGEVVQLVNISRRGAVRFLLPRLVVQFDFRFNKEHQRRNADLWTVLFEPDTDRFSLTWGSMIPVGHSPSQLREVEVLIDGLDSLRKGGAIS